jgi:hypothetical protein
MMKGDDLNSPYRDEEELHVKGKTVIIMKTTDIYCGRPAAGYQAVKGGLDVTFTPDLDKVHTLIDEYYNGERIESHGEGED